MVTICPKVGAKQNYARSNMKIGKCYWVKNSAGKQALVRMVRESRNEQ